MVKDSIFRSIPFSLITGTMVKAVYNLFLEYVLLMVYVKLDGRTDLSILDNSSALSVPYFIPDNLIELGFTGLVSSHIWEYITQSPSNSKVLDSFLFFWRLYHRTFFRLNRLRVLITLLWTCINYVLEAYQSSYVISKFGLLYRQTVDVLNVFLLIWYDFYISFLLLVD